MTGMNISGRPTMTKMNISRRKINYDGNKYISRRPTMTGMNISRRKTNYN